MDAQIQKRLKFGTEIICDFFVFLEDQDFTIRTKPLDNDATGSLDVT